MTVKAWCSSGANHAYLTRTVQRWICVVCAERVKQVPINVLSDCTTSLCLSCHAFLSNSVVAVKIQMEANGNSFYRVASLLWKWKALFPIYTFILFYCFFCIIFDCGKIFQDGHNPMFKIIKRSDSEMNYWVIEKQKHSELAQNSFSQLTVLRGSTYML